MAYILDSLTLPNPKKFTRTQRRISSDVLTFSGRTGRDYVTTKETYILEFDNLTQTQVGQIINKYNLNQSLTFQVTESNLTISARSVLMDIDKREYTVGGSDYRESLKVELTEV